MKHSHIVLFGANSFAIGLLTPVLSLVFLSRGATMETLSLFVGIFAVIVVVFELPSGILADMIGRKRIYLISALFMLGTYLFLLFGCHPLLLAVSCAMQGIGRAFSSGSIESLEIESYMDSHGSQSLAKINSAMAVTESAGLACGSIAGGMLGYLDNTYTLLLITAAAVQIFLLFMTVCFVREPKRETVSLSPFIQLTDQLKGLTASLTHSTPVTTIVLMAAACGLLLCTIEVYWQPTLAAFLPDRLGWIFGLVTCLGYLGVSIGSKLMEWILNHRMAESNEKKTWRDYWLLRFLLVLCIAVLGFSRSVWLFLFLFVLIYTVLGAGNLIENTIFHHAVANGQRAGMMSLLSLSTRAGGLITSLLGSLIVTGLSVSLVWILLPLTAALFIGSVMLFFYRKSASQRKTEPNEEPSPSITGI